MAVPDRQARGVKTVNDARHVIFISPSTMLGGGEMFLRELLPRLQGRGWRVTLVVPPQAPLARDAALAACATIVPIDFSMRVASVGPFIRSLAALWRLARANRRAVLYGNGFVTMKLLVLCRLLAGTTRTVCHLHESTYEYYSTLRARVQAPLVARFVAISEAVGNEFVRAAQVKSADVRIVHNGVEVAAHDGVKSMEWRQSERLALCLPVNGLMVGMAARTNSLKGHAVLLQAWSRVLQEIHSPTIPLHLVIAGLHPGDAEETRLHAELTAHIIAEGLGASVTTWGEIPLPQVRRLMRVSDLWIVPSTSEGFGRTAVEAMAESTALVASRVGGLAEIVTNGVDGVLVTPGDPQALAAAMLNLIRDDAERERLATNGHQTALKRFSVEAMVEKIQTICADVAATD